MSLIRKPFLSSCECKTGKCILCNKNRIKESYYNRTSKTIINHVDISILYMKWLAEQETVWIIRSNHISTFVPSLLSSLFAMKFSTLAQLKIIWLKFNFLMWWKKIPCWREGRGQFESKAELTRSVKRCLRRKNQEEGARLPHQVPRFFANLLFALCLEVYF